jgi:hypothetical protein
MPANSGPRHPDNDESFASGESPAGTRSFAAYDKLFAAIDQQVRYASKESGSNWVDDRNRMLVMRSMVERMFRRDQVRAYNEPEGVVQALWWYSENGNEEEAEFLKEVRIPPEQEGLRQLAMADIERRLSRLNHSQLSFPTAKETLQCAFFSLFLICAILKGRGTPWVSGGAAAFAIFAGLWTSGFLFKGAFRARRNFVSSACLVAAAVLMLCEVGSVLHVLSER